MTGEYVQRVVLVARQDLDVAVLGYLNAAVERGGRLVVPTSVVKDHVRKTVAVTLRTGVISRRIFLRHAQEETVVHAATWQPVNCVTTPATLVKGYTIFLRKL